MQQTSETWKALWEGGEARLEAVAEIGGVTYSAISAPVITRALLQDGLSVGGAVSATCRFSVLDAGGLPRSAEVKIRMRLTDGETNSEWLSAGTFYISHRNRDPVTGLVTLECYDALLKANATWAEGSGTWPRSMAAVAAELAALVGVELDSRNALAEGDAYVLDAPESGATYRDTLSKIAAANGGSWIMTPGNKLRLVPLLPGRRGDVVEAQAVTGGIEVSDAGTLTGLRYEVDGCPYIIGDASGIVVDADVTPTVALDLADRMLGARYQAYALRGAIYDPALELGDRVRAGANGEIVSAAYCETATLGPAFRGELSAPEAGEVSDEYPYIGGRTQAIQVLRASVQALDAEKVSADYVDGAVRGLDDSLDQQSVFNRLTNGGTVQGIYLQDQELYINGSYIQAGEISADRIQGGTLTLGGLNNANGWLRLLNADGDEIGSWTKDGIVANTGAIGDFTIDGGALQYGVTGEGTTGATIDRFGVEYSYCNPSSGVTTGAWLTQGLLMLRQYRLGALRLELYPTYGGIRLGIADKNNALRYPLEIINDANDRRTEFSSTYRVLVRGSLSVNGTKSRRVTTDQYSDRLLYCYETASPMFGDVGEGTIGEDGRCFVWLDPVLAQTIATEQYQVFLQRYGAGDCWVSERRGSCFIVEGEPGLKFGWELKAKQRDYDQTRLENAARAFETPEQGFGESAAEHIDALRKGRFEI